MKQNPTPFLQAVGIIATIWIISPLKCEPNPRLQNSCPGAFVSGLSNTYKSEK